MCGARISSTGRRVLLRQRLPLPIAPIRIIPLDFIPIICKVRHVQNFHEDTALRKFLILAIFALSGCASQIMSQYVGKPIEEPILDYGHPTNIVELSDGRRGYQWRIQGGGVMPITTANTSTVYAGGQVATVYSQTTNYAPFSTNCLYTLTARKQGSTYVVDGFRQPSFNCE